MRENHLTIKGQIDAMRRAWKSNKEGKLLETQAKIRFTKLEELIMGGVAFYMSVNIVNLFAKTFLVFTSESRNPLIQSLLRKTLLLERPQLNPLLKV